MVHLLIAVAVGIMLAVGAAVLATRAAGSAANGSPSKCLAATSTGTADPAGRW